MAVAEAVAVAVAVAVAEARQPNFDGLRLFDFLCQLDCVDGDKSCVMSSTTRTLEISVAIRSMRSVLIHGEGVLAATGSILIASSTRH